MREILFRGKAVKSGEWHYGMWCAKGYNADFPCIIPKNGAEVDPCDWRVDPATVGQYTGLCDKNGKRIFEGDIITAYFDGRESEPFRVCYGQFHDVNSTFEDDDFIGWCLTSPKFHGEFITILSETKNGMLYKVIGNTIDNPKLLQN